MSNSADLRRRGSVASLSSRGSYSRYSPDRWTSLHVSNTNESSFAMHGNKHILALLLIKFSLCYVCFPDCETEKEQLAPERQMQSIHIKLVGRGEDANPTLLWRKGGETHQAIWKHGESQGTALLAWLFIVQCTVLCLKAAKMYCWSHPPPPQLDKSPTWNLSPVLMSYVPWNGI